MACVCDGMTTCLNVPSSTLDCELDDLGEVKGTQQGRGLVEGLLELGLR